MTEIILLIIFSVTIIFLLIIYLAIVIEKLYIINKYIKIMLEDKYHNKKITRKMIREERRKIISFWEILKI